MLDAPQWLGAIISLLAGACVGSFVSLAAYRIPREISIVRPRSFCPRCRKPIPAWANMPIIAYLALRGRCHMCGNAIPFRYFLTELALAVAALYLCLSFPFWDGFARFVLCATLFVVAIIDYDWRVIPNIITFPGVPIGFIAAALAMPEIGWQSSLIGIAVGAGFLFVTGQIYIFLRGSEGVGLGDVYLLGMIGAFLGWVGVLFTVFVGSIFGSIGGIAFALSGRVSTPPDEEVPRAIAEVTGHRNDATADEVEVQPDLLLTEVPFGPFLALAGAIFALFQPHLTHWYLSH